MIILAIDTAAVLCAASIYDSDAKAEKGRAVLNLGKGHAEHVMTVIDEVLTKADISYGELDAVAVSVGPGSFTGVRVGVAAARGLALALKIPAIGVTTLEALAAEVHEAFPGHPVLAILGRSEPFSLACFDGAGVCVDGPRLVSLKEIAQLSTERAMLAGDAAEQVAQAASGEFSVATQAATADILFYARIAALRPADGEKPRPVYLRPPDAKPQSSFALPLKA